MSNVRDFGAVGDGQTDDTLAILHAWTDGDGALEFPPGSYRVTKTVELSLAKRGPLVIAGSQGLARLVMHGAGPAIRVVGTHGGTGDPLSVTPAVRTSQRMPTITGLEITGEHPEADGLELVGTMQPVIQQVLIQRVRHAIRLHQRNRNVIIANCHLYHNTGVGVFLDSVNLHQINILGNHISYNRLGGIRIEQSEIRNLQITGNDIEYNNHRVHGTEPEPTAEIHVDTTAEGASVAEVTIASNTIQATESLEGANIRLLGDPAQKHRPGLWTISGNVIGSQEINLDMHGCQSVSVTGNSIYSGGLRNVRAETCRELIFSGNTSRQHTPAFGVGWELVDCEDCVIQGGSLKDDSPDGKSSNALFRMQDSRRITITNCQFLDGVPSGLELRNCREVTLAHCTVIETREKPVSPSAIVWTGEGHANLISECRVGPAKAAALQLDKSANVTVHQLL